MASVMCPFCGVVSNERHETQQACIEALQAEIARTRRVLERVSEPRPPASPRAEDAPRAEDEKGKDKQLT